MIKDRLLAELAREARRAEEEQAAQDDARWEALARGGLSPEEEEAFRAEMGSSAAGAEALEAFTPLGEEFRRGVGDRILAEQASERSRPAVSRHAPGRPFLWAAAALVLAAVGAWWLLGPGSSYPPLPAYTASLSGGAQALRGDSAATPRQVFVQGNLFQLLLRPDEAVPGPLKTTAFFKTGTRIIPWRPAVEAAESGSLRVSGRVGQELRLPAGEAELLIAVGRPRRLPTGPELAGLLAREERLRRPSWSAWRFPVEYKSSLEE